MLEPQGAAAAHPQRHQHGPRQPSVRHGGGGGVAAAQEHEGGQADHVPAAAPAAAHMGTCMVLGHELEPALLVRVRTVGYGLLGFPKADGMRKSSTVRVRGEETDQSCQHTYSSACLICAHASPAVAPPRMLLLTRVSVVHGLALAGAHL